MGTPLHEWRGAGGEVLRLLSLNFFWYFSLERKVPKVQARMIFQHIRAHALIWLLY